MKRTIAGIVTFNPEMKRLAENITAVHEQVDEVVIVDNGSKNLDAVIEKSKAFKNVKVLPLHKNYGIAKALNEIFNYAVQNNIEWVLTLDQDSIVFDDIIECYSKYMDDSSVNCITCLRNERSYNLNQTQEASEIEEVTKCITSGNFVRVSVWQKCGGFTEKLFIDMVDSEFCYKLRRNGYKIHRINKPEMLHELGDAKIIRFLGKDRTVLNHSAFRKYYIFRNTIYVLRNYPEANVDYSYSELFKSFVAVVLYEKNKISKIGRIIKGVFDGIRMK